MDAVVITLHEVEWLREAFYIDFLTFQVELWKKYIAWERSNPLRTEDTSLVARRVMFAIEQCLLCLGHHPAVWHQAAHFLELSSKILTEKGDVNAAKNLSDEAGTMFERATNTLLSKNMLLYFAHADFEEGRVKYEKVHQIYQKFLDIPDIDPTLVSFIFQLGNNCIVKYSLYNCIYPNARCSFYRNLFLFPNLLNFILSPLNGYKWAIFIHRPMYSIWNSPDELKG